MQNRHIKTQIPSTKLQINLKSQFSMTKTFGILDFDHCYLFDIWDLLFDISINPLLHLR